MESGSPTDVGRRIRALRERQELTLRAVAERCGLSVTAISQIERGENSPTVASLHLLAGALGVAITEFFRPDDGHQAIYIPAGGRMKVESGGVRMENLGFGLPYQQLQPFLVTVEPGAGNADQPVSHTGEEFIFCASGELVYTVGGDEYHLRAGDSLLFESARPHHFVNPAAGPATFLLLFLARGGQSLAQQVHLDALRADGAASGSGHSPAHHEEGAP